MLSLPATTTDPTRVAAALANFRQFYSLEPTIKAEIADFPPDADKPARAASRLRVRQERAVLEHFKT